MKNIELNIKLNNGVFDRGEIMIRGVCDTIIIDTAPDGNFPVFIASKESARKIRDCLNEFLGDDNKELTSEINRAVEEIVRRNDEKMIEKENENYRKWVKEMTSQDERISNIEKKLEGDHEVIRWLTSKVEEYQREVLKIRNKVAASPVGASGNLEERINNLETTDRATRFHVIKQEKEIEKLREYKGIFECHILSLNESINKLGERVDSLCPDTSQFMNNFMKDQIWKGKIVQVCEELKEIKEWMAAMENRKAIDRGINMIGVQKIKELKEWKDKVCGEIE